MVSLNITLNQVINYAYSLGVSEITYHCPASLSSYYLYKDKSIHVNMYSVERIYETLACNYDIWLDSLDEVQVYTILHELGHHLQASYFKLKEERHNAEVDAWDKAEAILKNLNKEVPDNFYHQRDYCLDSYSDHKNEDCMTSQLRKIEERKQKLVKESEKEIKKLNLLITGVLSLSFLIGGVITYNSLQPKQPIQECIDFDCF